MIDLKGYEWQLLEGAAMTLKVSFFSLCIGLIFGIFGALAKKSKSKFLVKIADLYTTIVRGVPELLIIYLLFFGGTVLLTKISNFINPEIEYVEIDAFKAGVFALAFVFGAYATEVFRGALNALPAGQKEAAEVIGMSRFKIFFRITLPQLWRFALPGIGNLWLVLLKDSALISVVGLDELMRKSYIAAGNTKDPVTFYLTAAVMYLCFTIISMIGLQLLEKRANRGTASFYKKVKIANVH